MTKISIIIPAFNRENLIKECLDSILIQTNPNWEAVVVDDGSTDATWEIITSYVQKDPKIKAFKREGEPKGANRCRNQGVEYCTGDYVLFLDSDDLIGETCIESRINYINKHPKLDFIVFPEVGFIKNPKKDSFHLKHIIKSESDIKAFLSNKTTWLTSGPTIKKSFFNTIKFNEQLQKGQDWDLYTRCLLKNPKYVKVNSTFYPDVFKRMDSAVVTISNSQSISRFENKLISLKGIAKNYTDILINDWKKEFIWCCLEKEIWYMSLKMPFINILINYKIISKKEFIYFKFIIRINQLKIYMKRFIKKFLGKN